MSKITIKVSGKAGSGKSTVAEILMAFLDSNKFNVTHVPMDDLDFGKGRIEQIKDNCEITIIEEQLSRTGIWTGVE